MGAWLATAAVVADFIKGKLNGLPSPDQDAAGYADVRRARSLLSKCKSWPISRRCSLAKVHWQMLTFIVAALLMRFPLRLHLRLRLWHICALDFVFIMIILTASAKANRAAAAAEQQQDAGSLAGQRAANGAA